MELVSTRRHPPKNHKNASSPFDVFLWWDTNPDGNNRPLWTIKKSNFSVTTPKAQRGRAFVNKLFPRVDEAASAGSLRLSRITRGTTGLPRAIGARSIIHSLSAHVFNNNAAIISLFRVWCEQHCCGVSWASQQIHSSCDCADNTITLSVPRRRTWTSGTGPANL